MASNWEEEKAAAAEQPTSATKTFTHSSARPEFEVMGSGTKEISLRVGETSNWIRIPPGFYYDLYSPTNDDWEIWFWEGERLRFKPGEEKMVKFPKKYRPTFKIAVGEVEEGEEKNFILKVWPKNG